LSSDFSDQWCRPSSVRLSSQDKKIEPFLRICDSSNV
jgi:hypothetical protein